ncbi:MAG: fumarylacetoacetate hydrolase family protein, partial [Myxococcales bacterium]|nr:fumarylacetoacetate hydrolase family protein [Myxococcales bacterium]
VAQRGRDVGVIGTERDLADRQRALEVVAGYVVVNDLSVRDWQAKAATVTLGKSFDTHAPFGPWLVTADEIPDPQALRVRTTIDGETMQDARTDGMIFSIAEQIATLSTVMTLEPGDLVSTGTPEGVGKGRTPPRWLRVGERVRVEIERIGHIENEVVPEPESTTAL